MDEGDLAFESVLRNSGNIDNFLDKFFSFLGRRTDFFLECPTSGGAYGFPKGHAEKTIVQKFKEWQAKVTQNPPNFPHRELPERENPPHKPPVNTFNSSDPAIAIKKSSTSTTTDDSYNGSTTDKYAWSQTIVDLDIKIPVGSEIKKGNNVKVNIESNKLGVWLITSAAEKKEKERELVFEDKLCFPIVKDESFWNLIPGECIRIFLTKAQERWWTALLENEEAIDMKSIEPIKPMEDLQEDEQMKIHELLWNQDRKLKGLPTSEEMKMQEILKEAWNKDGSPFQGTNFDPSIVKLGQSTSSNNKNTTPINNRVFQQVPRKMDRGESSANGRNCNGFPVINAATDINNNIIQPSNQFQRSSSTSTITPSPRPEHSRQTTEENRFPFEVFHHPIQVHQPPPPPPMHTIPLICPMCCGFGVVPGYSRLPPPGNLNIPNPHISNHHQMLSQPHNMVLQNHHPQHLHHGHQHPHPAAHHQEMFPSMPHHSVVQSTTQSCQQQPPPIRRYRMNLNPDAQEYIPSNFNTSYNRGTSRLDDEEYDNISQKDDETDSEPDLTIHFGPRTFVPTARSIDEGLTAD